MRHQPSIPKRARVSFNHSQQKQRQQGNQASINIELEIKSAACLRSLDDNLDHAHGNISDKECVKLAHECGVRKSSASAPITSAKLSGSRINDLSDDGFSLLRRVLGRARPLKFLSAVNDGRSQFGGLSA
ncbi:hypothetical protein [Litorimonas haliclonae]|uniref:hypothetical protein n=1 Tax=Litorimonas haliclonae TaxID=2081977 RepID=UPI0039EE351D